MGQVVHGIAQLFGSGEDFRRDPTADIGQPEIAARVAVRQTRVIQSQQVKDDGVEVVDRHDVFDRE